MAKRTKQAPVFDEKDVQEAADAVLESIDKNLPRHVLANPVNEQALVDMSRDVARLRAMADGTSKEWMEGFARLVARRVSFRLPELLKRLRDEQERGL